MCSNRSTKRSTSYFSSQLHAFCLHCTAQRFVKSQPVQHRRQLIGPAGVHQHPVHPILDQIHQSPHPGGNDRKSARHRFQHRDGHALMIGGIDKYVSSGKQPTFSKPNLDECRFKRPSLSRPSSFDRRCSSPPGTISSPTRSNASGTPFPRSIFAASIRS